MIHSVCLIIQKDPRTLVKTFSVARRTITPPQKKIQHINPGVIINSFSSTTENHKQWVRPSSTCDNFPTSLESRRYWSEPCQRLVPPDEGRSSRPPSSHTHAGHHSHPLLAMAALGNLRNAYLLSPRQRHTYSYPREASITTPAHSKNIVYITPLTLCSGQQKKKKGIYTGRYPPTNIRLALPP